MPDPPPARHGCDAIMPSLPLLWKTMGEGMMLRLLLVVAAAGGDRSDGVPIDDNHAAVAPPHQVALSPATTRDGLSAR
ncbi:Os11g0273100 [Oryza sativa Japonica Group]|uniref:Os11g0273100 protein n=1 Tax=Oryza sativa subsp. japonica TaxID=39947 RepID=A0A0P0Y1B4_ORYSJ|nr:Os11g0273100 [Oryza sativa Japonica Group]